jgi:uncharacterized protein YihD (DUF1040 family)
VRDPKRIPEILKKIQEIWEQQPDLRLGQLLQIVSMGNRNQHDMFYYEDDALLKDLEAFTKNAA